MSSAEVTPEEAPPAVEATARKSLLGLTLSIAAVIILLDQLMKIIVVSYFEGRAPIELLGPVLRLNVVRNAGAAFSLGTGFTFVFALIACAVVVVLVRTARTLGSVAWAVALGGLLGGVLGNLIDRLFRAPGFLSGHVVDYLQLPHWPVFNIADMAIVGAAILMAYLTIRGIGLNGVRAGATSE